MNSFSFFFLIKNLCQTAVLIFYWFAGSSFPKAKPKHGFSTVAYLAVKRLLFLPVQYQWWIQQTSTYIFLFFLLLYLLQIYSVALYYIQTSQNHESDVSFLEIKILTCILRDKLK